MMGKGIFNFVTKKSKTLAMEPSIAKVFQGDINLTCPCGKDLVKEPRDNFMMQFGDDEETLEDYQKSFVQMCPHCSQTITYEDLLGFSKRDVNNIVALFIDYIHYG